MRPSSFLLHFLISSERTTIRAKNDFINPSNYKSLFIYLSTHLIINYLFIYLFIYSFIHPFIYLFVCLIIYCFYLFTCLFIFSFMLHFNLAKIYSTVWKLSVTKDKYEESDVKITRSTQRYWCVQENIFAKFVFQFNSVNKLWILIKKCKNKLWILNENSNSRILDIR